MRLLGQGVPDDPPAGLRRGAWRLVRLVDAWVRAVFPERRFGSGAMVLSVVAGSWGRGSGRTTSGCAPRRADVCFARTPRRFRSEGVGSVPCLGPCLEHGFGLSQAGPALWPPDDGFAD